MASPQETAGPAKARTDGDDGSRALLAAIVASSSDAILSWTLDLTITSWNDQAARLYGYAADEAIGRSILMLIPPEGCERACRVLEGLTRGETFEQFEVERIRKDGSRVEVALTVFPVRDESGAIVGAATIARDIARRRRTELALRESESRFRELADSMPQIVWTARPDGRIDYYNRRWYEYTGLPEGTMPNWHGVLHPDDKRPTLQAWLHSVRTGEPCELEYRLRDDTGVFRWHLNRARPIRDPQGRIAHWFATCTDIDDRKQTEADLARHRDELARQAGALRLALADKDVLFKEVHHRVKNNLQVICSLVRMQATRTPDPASRAALEDTYNRIYSISLVHEVLYGEQDAASLDMARYLDRLCTMLGTVYGAGRRGIGIRISAAGSLDLVTAVPVGLLINELVSNALRHGFPRGGPGEVRVDFRAQSRRKLVVADNGVGLPPDGRAQRAGSLGMTIIRALAQQLRADMRWESNGGTTVTVTFPE